MNNAGKGFEGAGTALIAGSVGDFAGDDGGTQIALSPIVGGLNSVMEEEAQDVAVIVLPAHAVQHALIIVIAQIPVSQVEARPVFLFSKSEASRSRCARHFCCLRPASSSAS